MTAPKPMTDERLAELQHEMKMRACKGWWYAGDFRECLAEIERLKEESANDWKAVANKVRLANENNTLRARVAELEAALTGISKHGMLPDPCTDKCLQHCIDAARAALAADGGA